MSKVREQCFERVHEYKNIPLRLTLTQQPAIQAYVPLPCYVTSHLDRLVAGGASSCF